MGKLTGRCLCEAIQYEINGELGDVYNCHCSKCRRWEGSAFRTSTRVKSQDFKWVCGEDMLAKFPYKKNIIKTFCSVCGSHLISVYPDKPEVFGISLGGLEQDPGVRPKANIFVGSKAPWYDITDSLPQHQQRVDD